MDPRIINKKLEILHNRIRARTWPISNWEFRTASHLGPDEYLYDGEWRLADPETQWEAGKTVFLRMKGETPTGISTQSLYIVFDFERMEGMLSIDGNPYSGIDRNHKRVPVPYEGILELEAEFISVPDVMCFPYLMNEKSTLREVAFEQVDRDLEAAWYDFSFAWEAGKAIRDSRRKQLVLAAIEEAMLAIDLTLPDDEFRDQISSARALLKEKLEHIAPDPEGGRVFVTGHSHIDTAWLWPVRETIRKCGRTFSTACRLMQCYPSFHFTCSQPQLYVYVKKHYPRLYDEIKHWVKQGRWETTGGMWVETDCNVPSGESLIRQVLYGLRFFRQEFGTRPRTCWLPDVFGYPGNLPQILKGCTLDFFYTNKLHWQARNSFPYHLFYWEGIDGSRVLAHIPKLRSLYNGNTSPEELVLAWDHYNEKAVHDELLYPYGFGDGGGGPTEQNLEFLKRAGNFPGIPACRHGAEEDYFGSVAKADPCLPVWRGELYLETHRGTYTSQGMVKRANRKNELLLRDAEILGILAREFGTEIDMETLYPAWEKLLQLQFHDILPGSSIRAVYEDAARDYESIEETASSIQETALDALAGRFSTADFTVFNTLSWPRSDIGAALLPASGGQMTLMDSCERKIPVQVTGEHDGLAKVVFSPVEVPATGCISYKLFPTDKKPETSLKISEHLMENRFFVVELNKIGEITRLYDKRQDREVVPPGETANQLQLFQDGPENEAAWNIHSTFEKRKYEFEGDTGIRITETGPVRGVVNIVKHHRESVIEQDIVLYDLLPRIDFVTRGEWRERQVMLKAAFPVEIMADSATYEVQFGAIQRPTHNNTSWDQEKFEVPAQRWADLSEAGYGVSLMNDCKYGCDVKGNVLRLTLLRGPEWPDPDADKGPFEFTYSLLPHCGDWREGETVRRAWELNVPLLSRQGEGKREALPSPRSFLSVDGPAILETLKPADDGNGLILRLYEPHGGRGKVNIALSRKIKNVTLCNLIEESEGPNPFEGKEFSFSIKPFQIRTFRVVT